MGQCNHSILYPHYDFNFYLYPNDSQVYLQPSFPRAFQCLHNSTSQMAQRHHTESKPKVMILLGNQAKSQMSLNGTTVRFTLQSGAKGLSFLKSPSPLPSPLTSSAKHVPVLLPLSLLMPLYSKFPFSLGWYSSPEPHCPPLPVYLMYRLNFLR